MQREVEVKKPVVVIVGAGISGLAAAQTLCKDGDIEVVVVEALDRVGGRIHTQKYNSRHIEFGAQWLHGERGNPLHEIAAENDLIDDDEPYESDLRARHYTQTGRPVSPKLVRQVETLINHLFEDANKFYRHKIPMDPSIRSVGAFFRQGFERWLKNTKRDTEQTVKLKEAIFSTSLSLENVENGCDSMYDLSLEAWGQYDECEGHEEVNLHDGFSSVVERILISIPESVIKLSTPVKRIEWNSNQGERTKVKVNCSDEGILDADYVIVTSSIGFLKQAPDFFQPKLPCDKIAAIEKIAFGVVDKLFLEFDEPFWERDLDSYKLIWVKGEPFKLEANQGYKFKQEEDENWYEDIPTFDTIGNQPNVLLGWISGRGARIMETLPDDMVRDACVELLQKFTGNTDIPKPCRFIRTRWYSNPYIRGSYCYSSKHHNTKIFADMSRPLPDETEPRLLFAGEACHATYFSTAHGAYLTGVSEAQRILNHLHG